MREMAMASEQLRIAPVSQEMAMNHVAEHVLGLLRSH